MQPFLSWLEQLGAGGNTYRAGTDPYQEGGILPALILLLAQQMGMGQQKGGFLGPIIEPIGKMIKMGFQKNVAQRGRGAGQQKGGFLGITDLIKMGIKKERDPTRPWGKSLQEEETIQVNHRLVGIGSSDHLESIVSPSWSTSHWGVT